MRIVLREAPVARPGGVRRVGVESSPEGPERIRALEARLGVLSAATRAFAAATSDPARLLQVVAQNVAAVVGDACVVLVLTDDGARLEPLASHSVDVAEGREVAALFGTTPVVVAENPAARRVLETGEAFVLRDVATARDRPAGNAAYRALQAKQGVHSVLMVALRVHGRSIGVLVLVRSRSSALPFDDADRELAEDLAGHAALAIGNARAYAAERAARADLERTTAALERSEAAHRAFFDELPSPAFVFDLETLALTHVNQAALDLYGYTRAEFLARGLRDLRPTAEQAALTARLAALDASDWKGEARHRRKDGTIIDVEGVSHLTTFAGRPARLVVLNDVTDRRRADAALANLERSREAERMFRSFLEAAPDALVIAGQAGEIVLVNTQTERLFGHARAALLGRPVATLVPEIPAALYGPLAPGDAAAPDARAPLAALELHGVRADGTRFPIEVSASPVETPDGVLVLCAVRDATVRRRADDVRRRLAAIVDASDDAIIGKRLDGVVTSWNKGAQQIFGYTEAEIVGRSIEVLMLPGAESEERRILAAVARGETQRFDAVRRRKDGRRIHVSVTTSPIHDDRGTVVGASKVARDDTERRQADEALARAKDAAEAASRELEAFSYSVAHDLRAPLRGMSGFAHLLLEEHAAALDAQGRDYLEEIRANAARMGALIDALLALSRVTRGELWPATVDLTALGRAVVAGLAAAAPDRRVDVTVADGLVAEVDPRLARSLLENLLGNAWKFTVDTAAARVELGVRDESGLRAFFVRDNGAGFDMAFANKLFVPLQRLHTATEFPGTGIGLATVQRIVQRHGGRIWAEGAVGQGAVFWFTLPGPITTEPA